MNILRTSDIRPDPVSRRNVQKFIKIKKFEIFTAKKSVFRMSVTLEMINEYKYGLKMLLGMPGTTKKTADSVYRHKKIIFLSRRKNSGFSSQKNLFLHLDRT